MITRETTINPLMQIFICSIFLEAPNRIVTLPFLVSPHHSVSSYRGSGSPDRPATSPLFPNTGLESSRSTMQAMPFLMQETSRWRQEEPSAQRRGEAAGALILTARTGVFCKKKCKNKRRKSKKPSG